jgi:hypothetical protein
MGFFCSDGGLLYANHQGSKGDVPLANTEISYNIWHDYHIQGESGSHGGLYTDNSSPGYTFHHNVIWNVPRAFSTNGKNIHDVYVYHNTLINIRRSLTKWGANLKDKSRNIIVRNNLSDGAPEHQFQGTEVDHNLEEASLTEFVDPGNGNYRLKPSSPSIDKGVAIKGINDGAVNAPDLGAYEYGGKDWTAGATRGLPEFPDEPEWDPMPLRAN